jgi:repressor LexA
MAREITKKQQQVLDTLENYWEEHKVPPSIADLAGKLCINKATAYEHLLALKKKGLLVYQARAGRTWRLAQPSLESATAGLIPILGQVAAGVPILAHENIEGHVAVDPGQNTSGLFALRVRGDSMINAHIQDRDLVIARSQPDADHNDIVVALIDGEGATVKRLDKKSNPIRLLAANDEFPPMQLPPERISILGKVVEVRRVIA